MMPTSVLLESTNGKINLVGEPKRVDSWTINPHGILSLSINVFNFTGRIVLEGSLEEYPTENGWFPLWLGSNNYYVQFPQNDRNPTGEYNGDSGTFSFQFRANVLWLRASCDRKYLNIIENSRPELERYGVVERILVRG